MHYLFADMFENISLYENKTEKATYSVNGDGKYEVTIAYSSKKLRSDSLGNTSEVPMKDLIDIGVYGRSADGEDKLLYLQKHLIESGSGEVKLLVDEKPTKAGIDPINKLIDRTSDDNSKSVVLAEVIW